MKWNVNMKNVWLASVAGTLSAGLVMSFLQTQSVFAATPSQNSDLAIVRAALNGDKGTLPDFTTAAEQTVNAVVHVKTKVKNQFGSDPFFDLFFGQRGIPQQPESVGVGSGVIIAADGYIITNNHVIDGASEIEVVLNDKRSFIAKLVGTDPSSDIALLKIDAKDLSFIGFGDSETLKLGEWVLAIGNPFNLNSTVTAGIVSAKARNINIIPNQFKVEAFIQTDAAVNPGNSGGALVNLKGELVGINTAIASQTGSFSGYSFAVPSNIAKKVVSDLMSYGVVQRAVLGVSLAELTAELAKENKISDLKGVYVADVLKDGAAEKVGIRKGDVIYKINDVPVNSVAQLQEQIGQRSPNDQVTVFVERDNKDLVFTVILRNRSGNTSVVKSNSAAAIVATGIKLADVGTKMQRILNIKGGAQITSISDGPFKKQGVQKGFIILRINREPVISANQAEELLVKLPGEAVLVEGIYPNGQAAYFAVKL